MRKAFHSLKSQVKDQVNSKLNQTPSSSPSYPGSSHLWSANTQPYQQQQLLAPIEPGHLLQQPTENDVLAYRFHHGTNIGGIFVLEKWLFGDLFVDGAKGDSELDAVASQVTNHNFQGARSNFDSFWSRSLTPEDCNYLALTASTTTIRLPIGYFTFGWRFTRSTPFEPYAEVYKDAWSTVKSLIQKFSTYGIGVLIDLHALPGGANKDAHSGTSSGRADLWGNSNNLDLAKHCIEFLARECLNLPTVVGLQIVNEAIYNAPGLYQFYDEVVDIVYNVNPRLLVYIPDAWDLPRALEYSKSRNAQGKGFVVVDTHKYYCFSDEDKKLNPEQIINKVGLSEVDAVKGQGAGCIVGEYSCVMDEKSWGGIQGGDRTLFATEFGRKQSAVWQNSSGGSFSWTYKMAWMPGGEWGFRQQTDNYALPPLTIHTLPQPTVQNLISQATSSRVNHKNQAVGEHVNYWNKTSPGQYSEHDRFANGWDLGFDDALTFFSYRLNHQPELDGNLKVKRNGGDKIGLVDVWIKRREIEYDTQQVKEKGNGVDKRCFWEFNHGVTRGIKDFENIVGA